jgi:hypothetical protein
LIKPFLSSRCVELSCCPLCVVPSTCIWNCCAHR